MLRVFDGINVNEIRIQALFRMFGFLMGLMSMILGFRQHFKTIVNHIRIKAIF